MGPFIADKKSWPMKPDVMYDKEWPMRQARLLFARIAVHWQYSLDLWKKLPPDSNVEEVIRNFFIRQPILWVPEARRGEGNAHRAGEFISRSLKDDNQDHLHNSNLIRVLFRSDGSFADIGHLLHRCRGRRCHPDR